MNLSAEALRLRRRRRLDRAFHALGAASVLCVVAWIAFLCGALIWRAIPAFTATELQVAIHLDQNRIPQDNPRRADWRGMLADALAERAGEEHADTARTLLSGGAVAILRDYISERPEAAGTTVVFSLPVADALDQYRKGLLAPPGADRSDDAQDNSPLTPAQVALFDRLRAEGDVRTRFAHRFFVRADSRFPALAGIAGAAIGSLLAIFVCFAVSFPVGLAAAIWFEEFAPRGRMTDLFRINVYNLAAVPSILFGLLGLAVFLNLFGMPRGSPLVGGLVLSLMTLPTIIVAAGAAIHAVPRGLRESALALGASRQEAVFHHILPYAMPGILTGTIIGLARALGETAPLLLIGMNAFLPDLPAGAAEPATALPAQIFLWADQPERGFVSRTAAAIVSLLVVLVGINLSAIFLRRHFENRTR